MLDSEYTRRHSRWYEKIILSLIFQFLIGTILIIFLSSGFSLSVDFYSSMNFSGFNSLVGNIAAFAIVLISLRKVFRFPGAQSSAYVFPITTVIFLLLFLFFLFFRILYSNFVFAIGYATTLLWCYFGYFIGHRYRMMRYAVVPFGEAENLSESQGVQFYFLKNADISGLRFNGIIADLNAQELNANWQRFLAKCTLFSIPIYHIKQIRESMTGRVKIDRLSENEFGALLPSSFYSSIKRILDLSLVVLFSPIFLFLICLVGLLIKIDSKGPVFFIQKRMGFRAKTFRMVKFRSMYIDKTGLGFTKEGSDPRVTRVGKFIRKYRLDELPQIINVAIGQMSFIGPRPESSELSEWYEKDVPFFSYRHVVRPGISGWAQVNQGYAAEVDGMNIKLEYDFYYIKHFSFWLDILIIFKTFRTILTGFGAR